MMVGGPRKAVKRLAPILDVLAPETNEQSREAIGPRGWLHFGDAGAGHYVKMVHNGIEYGLMQAYAEGFELFDACEYELDNAQIAHLWGQGSVVRSWLCELAARAFEAEGNDLEAIEGYTRGLRRGSLDDRRRDRARRADARDHGLAVCAPALARERRLRRSRARGAAQPVRRARGRARARARHERVRREARGRVSMARASEASGMAAAAAAPVAISPASTVGEAENPLAAGLERQPVAPTTLVIFGATGDLARRKLLPALYNLAHDGALPRRFHLVGVARRERAHKDYRAECEQAIRDFSRRKPDEDVLKQLLASVKYVPGTFDDARRVREARGGARRVREGGRRASEPRVLSLDGPILLRRDRR